MKAFRALSLIGAIVAFALAMLGSWTRINAAGMTCPDWPACRGAVVPVLQGGVVLEWTHRLLALILTLVVIGVIVAGLRVSKRISGVRALLLALAATMVIQVLLGGVTIFAANSPPSVTLHWGTAMLLLASLTSLVVVGFANPGGAATFGVRRGTWPMFVTCLLAFAAMCAGAFVSSSGAGFACTGLPGCGSTFFGESGAQEVHMAHRLLAMAFFVSAAFAAFAVPAQARRATVAVRVGLLLLALQIALGILNVALSLPAILREAHAANAIATFLAFVVGTVLVSLESSPARAGTVGARSAAATPATH